MIFGHRGASAKAPENTLPAFELARNQGADGVELDVQLTADNQLVVVHDERLERVSNGLGYVKDYTLNELKQLDFSKSIDSYESTQIATLEEVYQLLKDTNMLINVELKTGAIWYDDIEEKVLRETEKYEMKDRVIYSSFNHHTLIKLKQLNPTCKTGMLFSDVLVEIDRYAKNIMVDALHPSLDYMKMIHKLDEREKSALPMRVWDVNERNDLKWMMENFKASVITNDPKMALEVQDEVAMLTKR